MHQKPKRHPAVTALLWAGVVFFVLLFVAFIYAGREGFKRVWDLDAYKKQLEAEAAAKGR